MKSRPWILLGGGLILLALAWGIGPFWGAYLAAVIGWSTLPIGALGLLAAHRLLGGVWGERSAPVLGAMVRTLPATFLLFVPLLLNPAEVWVWARPGGMPPGPGKDIWFDPMIFAARTIGYFIIWSVLGHWLLRDPGRRPGRAFAALAALAVLGSLAGVDWVLSLAPRFNSSAFGPMFLAHSFVAALGFMIAVELTSTTEAKPGTLGALLLAALIAWTYVAYFQYLVVYTGNIPAEMVWYLRRSQGEWRIAAWVLAVLLTVPPILLLMWRKVRLHPQRLAAVAMAALLGTLLHAAWLVLPEFAASGMAAPLAAMAGLGMVWGAAFTVVLTGGIDPPIGEHGG